MLMTALPLIWGEGGAFDPASRPQQSYKKLQKEFRVRPLDVLDEAGLASGRLLLLAQPRALAPAELVALDEWVRGGGRALILTDPVLVWPSALPIGDVRRPPPIGLLGPLLAHWGLALDPPAEAGPEPALIETANGRRRIVMGAPGRLRKQSGACRIARLYLASCAIGRGRAILLADADLLHDETWLRPGTSEDARPISDNPLLIADYLDVLAGLSRARHGPEPRGGNAIRVALPILFFTLALSFWARRRRRGKPQAYPQASQP